MFHLYSLKFYTQDQNPIIEDSHPKIIMGFIIFAFTFFNYTETTLCSDSVEVTEAHFNSWLSINELEEGHIYCRDPLSISMVSDTTYFGENRVPYCPVDSSMDFSRIEQSEQIFLYDALHFINFCKKRQLEYAVPHLDTIQFAASVSVVNSLQEHIITNINTRNDVYKLGNTFRLLKMIHPGDIYDTDRMLNHFNDACRYYNYNDDSHKIIVCQNDGRLRYKDNVNFMTTKFACYIVNK